MSCAYRSFVLLAVQQFLYFLETQDKTKSDPMSIILIRCQTMNFYLKLFGSFICCSENHGD